MRAAAARPHTVAPARSKRRRWGSARAWAGEASGGSAETLASRPPARSALKRPGPSGGRRRTLRWWAQGGGGGGGGRREEGGGGGGG